MQEENGRQRNHYGERAHDQRSVRNRRELQPFELNQELHRKADHRGNRKQPNVRPVSPAKQGALAKSERNQRNAGKEEAVGGVFGNRHLPEIDFAEEKTRAPKTSGA